MSKQKPKNKGKPAKNPERFGTRSEALTYIVNNELEGQKKPRRDGSKWFLVDVEAHDDVIRRPDFVRIVAREMFKATGQRPDPIEVQRKAQELWDSVVGRKGRKK